MISHNFLNSKPLEQQCGLVLDLALIVQCNISITAIVTIQFPVVKREGARG